MATETIDYLVPASAFKVGQRVRLSRYAISRGITLKRGVTEGVVHEIGDTLGIDVLVDGYARPKSFLAGFWEPVNGWE